MQIVHVTGRLTKDAETRAAGSSTVCAFSVASNEKVKGEKVVTFWDCSMWGKRGEAVAPYLTKGSPVSVSGRMSTREYNGKTYLQCEVDQLELMGSAQKRDADTKSTASDSLDEPPPF